MKVVDYQVLARLEEQRVSASFAGVADESHPFGGGVMCRGTPGTWFNAAIGMGFAGEVSVDEVRAMARFFEERGIEPRAEVCPYAHPSLIAALAAERFVVRLFETVFFRRVDASAHVEGFSPPDGLTLRAVDAANAADVDEYARVATSGFLPEGIKEWPEEMIESVRRVLRKPTSIGVKGIIGGRCIAAGGMEVSGEIAALYGVSVDSAHRRRGVQMALIDWRLREAAKRGAKWVTIASRPGVPTERNAQRAGFQVGYTKAVLVRPGKGLAPVME